MFTNQLYGYKARAEISRTGSEQLREVEVAQVVHVHQVVLLHGGDQLVTADHECAVFKQDAGNSFVDSLENGLEFYHLRVEAWLDFELQAELAIGELLRK